jgi:Fic family protein
VANPRLGTYIVTAVAGEKVRAFVPPPLPPDPPLRLADLQTRLEQANQALGRLDGLASNLPNLDHFIYMYVRKEAVLSSQIEGTQSSLSDLLLFENAEAPGVPLHDVQEVSNYVAAIVHGQQRLREGFPLSLRLIRELHETLLSTGRGSGKQPGEFRRSQNWIGGTRPGNAHFVPRPPEKVMESMGALELFPHRDSPDLPLLVKAALVHVQFESIHPFLDGNGRVGRLLIVFLLCAAGVLREPILYLSLYFKTHRRRYYESLDRVRTAGDWEGWLEFFPGGGEGDRRSGCRHSPADCGVVRNGRTADRGARAGGRVSTAHPSIPANKSDLLDSGSGGEAWDFGAHRSQVVRPHGEAGDAAGDYRQAAAPALCV